MCLYFALAWNAVVACYTIAKHCRAGSARAIYIGLAIVMINVTGWAKLICSRDENSTANYILCAIHNSSAVNIELITLITNLVTFTTITLIVTASCALAARANATNPVGVAYEESLFVLSMYSAAALLVVGSVEIYTLYRWGAEILQLNPAIHLPSTFGIAWGALCTLLLVALYAPIAIIRQLTLQRLGTSLWKIGGALLAPFITGLLTDVARSYLVRT
jgi:hypothetical protein